MTAPRLLAAALVAGSILGVMLPDATTAATAAMPQRPACADAGSPVVEVRAGDTWYGIAARYDVTVGALLGANQADETRVIHPGDELCLPDGAATPSSCTPVNAPTVTVEPGDSLFGIAARTGVTIGALLAANGTNQDTIIHPGEVLCLPMGATPPSDAGPGDDTSDSTQSTGGGDGGGEGDGAGSGSPADAVRYTVAPGDSWFGIAQRVGVAVRALLTSNESTVERMLHPGDELRLPAGAQPPEVGGGAGGDGGSGDPDGSGSSADAVRYTVASGDSWSGIAQRAGISLRSLLESNESTVERMLHPGDELRLPAGAELPTPLSPHEAANPDPDLVTLEALPVQGPCWYQDGWGDPRGNGRVHVGVDYFTVSDQYVYAVVDGRLTGRAWDQPGLRAGNAWWLTGADGTRYFYAHLSDFAPDLEVGMPVTAGQILGRVGDTGNAPVPHLHFEIRPRGGAPVNPYPIVRAAGGCNRGTPYEQPGGWVPPRVSAS